MQKNIGQTGLFITLFVGIVIGMIAIGAIFTQITGQSSVTTVTDDQFTMSNTSCVDVTTNCIRSLTSVENITTDGVTTNPIGSGNYSLCNVNAPISRYDGILVSGDAQVDVLNGLTLNATYEGVQCDYISNSTTRLLITYIPLLAVLALLVYVIVIGGITKT